MSSASPKPKTGQSSTISNKANFEDTLLLSFTAEIAQAQTRPQLLALITSKLKTIFAFSKCCLILKDNADIGYNPFLLRSSNEEHFKECELLLCQTENQNSTLLNNKAKSDGHWFVDVDEVNSADPELDLSKLLRASGSKEIAVFPLNYLKKSLGFLYFFYDNKEHIDEHVIVVMTAIARLISIAIAHIIDIEESERRENERLILLDLSHDLAIARDKDELLNLINTRMKKLFYFTHSAISLVDKNGNTFTNFLLDPESRSRASEDYEKFVLLPQPVNDGFYDAALAARTPLVFDLEKIDKTTDIPGYLRINIARGIKEFIISGLPSKEANIGAICFFSDIPNKINQYTLSLLEGVSHQISTAVANIIANEEIKEREREKSALLELSNDMSKINNKEDLMDVIKNKLRSLLSAFGFVIGLIDHETSTHYAYCIDQEELAEPFPEFKILRHQKFPVVDGYFERVMASDEPVTFQLDTPPEVPDEPGYITFWRDFGFKSIIGVKLRAANDNIGVIWIHSEETVNTNLLKGVCAQVSVTISNILSNDEIQKREQEKSILLAFSNNIAGVRSKKDLSKVINQNLKALGLINEYIISTVNEEDGTHQAFLFDNDAEFTKHPAFPKLAKMVYDIADQVMERVIVGTDPVKFQIDDLMELEPLPPYVPFWKGMGMSSVIGVPLISGEKPIAVLWIAPNNINDHVLKSVSAQIAVAVSNILSLESLKRRENEKSILLTFSNDIARVRSKDDLAIAINRTLKGLSLIKIYIIRIIDDDGIYTSTYIYDPTDNFVNEPAFQPLKKAKYLIKDGLHDQLLSSDEPVFIKVKEIMKRKDAPLYAKFWHNNLKIDTIMGSALRTGNTDIGFIWAEPDQINTEMFQSMCAQISIAISNILANERIEQQLKEISSYKERLEEENFYLHEEITSNYNNSEIIGSGAEMQKVFHLLSQVAFTNSTVLLLGETGTGKELVARAIHNNSPRKDKLMVKVNCATMPATLIESELFGHERGSFTGAFERRLGKFELAHKGTLFLDEIGEMPLE